MARRPPPRLRPERRARLRLALDTLLEQGSVQERLDHDPLSLPRRYANPADIEVAAVVAACLAFGRVASFLPVAAQLLSLADHHGGGGEVVAFPDCTDP